MVRSRTFALALVLAAASLVVTSAPASALGKPKGVKLHGAPGTTSISVQWKWAKKPNRYRVQISKKKHFKPKKAVRTKVVKAAKRRPHKGRQVTTFKHLKRETHYHYRVRAEKGKRHSRWSRTRSAWTKVSWPASMSHLKIVPGNGHGRHGVGEVTLTWHSSGAHIARFTISTALTHFGLKDKRKPPSYHRFTFSKKSARTAKRHVFKKTLTAAQLRKAHASVASAHFLYAHLTASNANNSHTRPYPGLQALVPLGRPASGAGEAITVANYNILGYQASQKKYPPKGHWSSRKKKVVANIVAAAPDIITLQEDSGKKIGNQSQASELLAALNNRSGATGHTYAYNRERPYKTGSTKHNGTQATALLYAKDEFEQVPGEECTDERAGNTGTSTSCAFTPGNDDRWATYVHLQSKTDPGVKFWVISAHPNAGRDKASEKVRRNEIKNIVAEMDRRRNGEPVILGMDSNTWQAYRANFGISSLSHNALIGGGYYDTAASVRVGSHITTNYPRSNHDGAASMYRYSTGNQEYSKSAQRPSKNGYAPRLDVIATKGLRGADNFGYSHATRRWPGSDHNLVWAKIRLPRG